MTIAITDIAPGTFTYSPVDMDLTLNQAMAPNTVSPGGGAVTSWEIEPDVPNGLNFGSSNGTIWGTPTVLQTSPITYTVWANNSGGSSSTTVTITIIDDAAVISYSLNEIVATLGVPISPHSNPTNTGGAVETWEISPDPGPHFQFNTANGIISGTPGALLTRTQYTIYANNSGGSAVANVHVTVNDVAPSITYSEASLTLVVNTGMTPLPVINSGGTIVSCSDSPTLPTGLSLSNTCEITGTPTVTTTNISYTITATNTGGTDSTTIFMVVQSNAGTLTISPIHTEGSVNSTISDITMTYNHAVSSYGWSSGVSNISSVLSGNLQTGDGSHWLGIDSGEQGEMAVVFARNDTGATTHDLALRYLWNGVWTESLIDNGIDTGQHPSVAIDRHGALHIAYVDLHNGELRYATNASGSWVLSTLGVASVTGGGRGTAIVVHPITDAVHIVTTINENTYRDLQYHTNQGGSWVNETITNTSRDEGNDPSMVMDGDGNLYVAYYCNVGCNDLRMSSRINGVWQNETIAGVANLYNTNTNHYNIGTTPEMAIDSQGTLHIVSQFQHNQMKRMYLHSGTPGNWFENRNLSSEKAHWPAIAVDSNDAVHIAYHIGANKHLKYLTNASGSWIAPVLLDVYGGWGSVMEIDANDDIFIAHSAPANNAIHLTTVKGSGQGLTAIPVFDIAPPLPDGLTMNWRTGTISGTPTEEHVNSTHTVTVTALGFTTTATFTLYITGAPGSIAYADISGTHLTPITSQYPTFTNSSTSGEITSWETDPMLPTGLNIGSTNGTIWGTPTVIIAGGVYVIWANNSVGSASTTVNITINAQAPGSFNYNPMDMDLTLNQAMTPNTVSPGGGAVISWEIEPDVPNGLNFGSSNGTIWGTPTVLQTSPVTYTIWANNSGGSSSTTVTITINDEVPTLSYPSSPYTIVRGYDMTDITQ
ncbi:MAG: hypothetical protein CM15mP3_09720 [Candidatus Poseidoniales archaeon]|nr:MAG: hypothetical protein CM15mP3_09720 [Candidatus Poseidoniales archaeon]